MTLWKCAQVNNFTHCAVYTSNPNPADRDLIHEILFQRNSKHRKWSTLWKNLLLTCRLKSIPFCSKCQKRERNSDLLKMLLCGTWWHSASGCSDKSNHIKTILSVWCYMWDMISVLHCCVYTIISQLNISLFTATMT